MTQKQAPAAYDLRFMQQLLNDLQTLQRQTYAKTTHIDLNPNTYIIMTSPNGTRYSLTVSNAGAVVVTAV